MDTNKAVAHDVCTPIAMVRINIVVKIELAKYAVVTGGWLD